MEHEGEQYAEHDVPEDESVWTSEYPENSWLQGRCNTLVSQVAVCKRLDESEDESVVICLVLTPDFSLFSADAVHVRICVGQEHGVFSHATVVSKHAITKETTAKFTFPSPNRMPPARKDDTKSSVKWKTTRKADQGSIAVFVTRGRCKIGQYVLRRRLRSCPLLTTRPGKKSVRLFKLILLLLSSLCDVPMERLIALSFNAVPRVRLLMLVA